MYVNGYKYKAWVILTVRTKQRLFYVHLHSYSQSLTIFRSSKKCLYICPICYKSYQKQLTSLENWKNYNSLSLLFYHPLCLLIRFFLNSLFLMRWEEVILISFSFFFFSCFFQPLCLFIIRQDLYVQKEKTIVPNQSYSEIITEQFYFCSINDWLFLSSSF